MHKRNFLLIRLLQVNTRHRYFAQQPIARHIHQGKCEATAVIKFDLFLYNVHLLVCVSDVIS